MTPIMLLLLTANILAQNDDEAAVLTLMDRAFDAVRSGNPDDWRAIQLAGGMSISFRARLNGVPGDLEMRMRTNEEEAVAAGADDDHEYTERWVGNPTVMTRGPIATVWGAYEFRIDGAFSHCGIDAADLVKVDGEWKIANWMWTVEKENCPTGHSVQPEGSVTLPHELDRVLRDYERSWRAHDAEALAAVFARDGFILRPGHPPVRGREAIAEAYRHSGGQLRLRALSYATADSVGYIIGDYGTRSPGFDDGKYILTLRLDGDGRWYITADMDNSNE